MSFIDGMSCLGSSVLYILVETFMKQIIAFLLFLLKLHFVVCEVENNLAFYFDFFLQTAESK